MTTDGAGERRRSPLIEGALSAALLIALTLLATFPGRRALAAREAAYGRSFWQYLLGGLAGDLAGVLPLVVAAWAGPSWAAKLSRRLFGRPRSRTVDAALSAAVLVVATGALWLFALGASEFKIQRGLYPTWYETHEGMAQSDFVWGSLPTVTLRRYLLPNLIFFAALAAAAWRIVRIERRPEEGRERARWIGRIGASIAACAVGGAALLATPVLFPQVDHRRELYPPLVTIYKSMRVQQKTAIFRGLRAVLAGARFDEREKRAGAAPLGFSPAQADRVLAAEKTADCAHHPLARPLPAAEGAPPLEAGLVALSRPLFDGRSGDLAVFQIAIESFRADDVYGLHQTAPVEVAPFTSALFERALAPQPGAQTIAFPRAYQGGQRTSQAISGLLCGLGAMPFNLAISRDLGYVPLRCLPDVLAEAGFKTEVDYGSDLSFDNMIEFFRYHGVATRQRIDFPKGLPTGTWSCITDWPVLDDTLRRAAAEPGPQYRFVLTLAGHTPFQRPEDLPAEVEARLDRGLAASGRAVSGDDRGRLATVAYADWALERFVAALDASPLAARSIVILSADHATGDPFLWGGEAIEGGAHIPLAILLPRALVDSARAPDEVRRKVAALNALARTTPVSANDSPTLLLALLAAQPRIAALPPDRRWATLGGDATSPDFQLPGRAAGLWGIDAGSNVFQVAREPGSLAAASGERSELFADPSQLRRLGPILRPVAAFSGSFLAGWAARCPGQENIRRGP